MKFEELSDIIEKRSPLELQEPWDNSGAQIRFSGRRIERVLVALEITGDVIYEAVNLGVQAIITHHPLFFDTLKNIYDDSVTGDYIIKLIQNHISVYSSHTPFDKCNGGNNDYLAKILHLCDIHVPDETGFCRVGTIDGQCDIKEYIEQISRWLNIDKRKMSFSGDLKTQIRKVALCTGAGAEYSKMAIEWGCDLFITGDVKYHQARLASESGMNVLDIGHYGSEKIFTENMVCYLRNNTDLDIIKSKTDSDPFILI